MPGPRVRTDIVEVFVVRGAELLLLRRAQAPMLGTWQPVLGHAEVGETAVETARRELCEETGLASGAGLDSLVALERVCPYFLPDDDAVVLSPRFVARAACDWEPRLCDEHDAARWTPGSEAATSLCWPSQRETWQEVLERRLIDGR